MKNGMQMLQRGLLDFFGRGSPFGRPRATSKHLRPGYRQEPSFTDLLPWLAILENHFVLLDDGRSVGAVLELKPALAEGRSPVFLRTLQEGLTRLLTDTFAEYAHGPWVLQVFAFQDERGLEADWRRLAAYRREAASSPYRKHFEKIFAEHISDIARPEGLFEDPLSERPWRGSRRRVLACIYRRRTRASGGPENAWQELAEQRDRLQKQLAAAGVGSRTCTGSEIYNWLLRWLHPRAADSLLRPMAGENKTFDYSLADAVASPDTRSEREKGLWYFDGLVHRALGLQRLRGAPLPGQLSAERIVGDIALCPLEQMPPGTALAMTLAFIPQSTVHSQLDRVEYGAVGETAAALVSREAAQSSRRLLLEGNKVYPFSLSLMVRAADPEEMEERCAALDTLLLSNRLQIIPPALDPVALDAYLRHLPMGYRYGLDQVRRRNRMIYASDAAALLPLYGRATGTGRPVLTFFNRGGELFSCDPLSLEDRSKNAHLFLFGPTGAGKSAALVYLQMTLMAFYKPRIIAVEAGNSFGLLSQFFHAQGLSARDVVLRPGCGASLPPFAGAAQLAPAANEPPEAKTQESANAGERDLLGEFTLIARLMVTGGQATEEASFSRADEAALRQALLQGGTQMRRAGRRDLRVSELCQILEKMAAGQGGAGSPRGARLQEMAAAMSLFTTGFAGELFDRPGIPWPEADYLRLEMGTLADAQHAEQLAVAWLGLVNAVVAMAERSQRDGRPTILITDEAHVITGNPLLAGYVVKVSKLLGRRLGLWLWMATQNMKDFCGEAEKMLSMFEWWLCLHPGKGELEELERFRRLTPQERDMLLSTRKVPGCYTEGVLLSDTVQGLFRSVPPALCLALAQTEKEEKTRRARIMAERGCSEMEAAFVIAEELAAARRREGKARKS